MRRPYHKTVILVVAVVAVLYFRGTETQLLTEPSSDDGFEANSVSDSATSTLDASDKPSLSAAESVSDSPADSSELTTDDIMEQMKQGNFSNVEFRQPDRESMIKRLDGNYNNYEWVECNLNQNGLKGLVLQDDSGSYDEEINQIKYIFAFSNDKVIYVAGWGGGGRIVHFLSGNGNLIESYGSYGTASVNSYKHFIFDDELYIKYLYELEIRLIDDWYEEQVRGILKEQWDDDEQREKLLWEWGSNAKSLEELIESYPERTTTGEYYKRIDRTGEKEVEETLTKQQFLDAFEEMTGYSFYEVNPEGMYMRDDLESSQVQ